MSANTSPDNIVYPVSTDNIAPLETVFSVMAGSVQDALDVRQAHSYKWANATARGAQTGMAAGDSGYQSDTDTYWNYNGTAWDYTGSTVQLKMGTVSSVIVSTPQRGIEKITGAAATKITKTVTFLSHIQQSPWLPPRPLADALWEHLTLQVLSPFPPL